MEFGLRQAERADGRVRGVEDSLASARAVNESLRDEVLELRAKLEVVEIKELDATTAMQERHSRELAVLRGQIEQLQLFLNR